MFKRISLLILTNLAIMLTLSVIIFLMGLQPYLTANGLDYQSLMVFCSIWGTLGAFISLQMSKWVAKQTFNLHMIDLKAASSRARSLLMLIEQLCQQLEIAMPEVGIYASSELNAFATGPSQTEALVAISTGLLEQMSPEALEGVLGHELSHIANGDMVTMTLLQGVVNAFSLFLSRLITYALISTSRREENERVGSNGAYQGLALLFDFTLALLGTLVLAAFSRHREYRADKGAAQLVGVNKMISALESLIRHRDKQDNRRHALAALKIAYTEGGLFSLFATHPPLEQRIARLQQDRELFLSHR